MTSAVREQDGLAGAPPRTPPKFGYSMVGDVSYAAVRNHPGLSMAVMLNPAAQVWLITLPEGKRREALRAFMWKMQRSLEKVLGLAGGIEVTGARRQTEPGLSNAGQSEDSPGLELNGESPRPPGAHSRPGTSVRPAGSPLEDF